MELSLDLSLVNEPKSMSEFLRQISRITDSSQKLSKIDNYVKRLEDEMRKIDAFKRELPLCMLLLSDAIGRLKEEAMHCTELNDRSVVEEFKPLKGNSDEDGGANMENDCGDKKNWMSSVQLWSTNINSDHNQEHTVSQLKSRSEEDDRSAAKNPIQPCNYRNRGGAFVPFKARSGFEDKEKVPGLSLMTPISELGSCNSISKSNISSRLGSGSSLYTDQNQVKLQQQQQQNSRKQRRCWSPELHRRFVDVLQQLGGSQVATPKQIRELMQVDGLTNDEVKSHLQKYRLHIRKVPGSSATAANALWMGKNECGDPSKQCISQSVSPQGPLLANGSAKGISSDGDDSMEAEEDEKSDGHSWKAGFHRPEEVVHV